MGTMTTPRLPPVPPPEFDGEPDFDYQILTVSPGLVRRYCRGIEHACAIPRRRVIVISDQLKGPVREAFLRHEKGHLRGWLDCRETVIADDHDHSIGESTMTGPVWLDRARTYVGTKEIPGPRHNPLIVRWWEAIKAPFRDDETAWCSAFVGGVLEEAGMTSTRSAAARSWLNHGVPLDRPAVGAIVVFWRGKPTGWSGHVGFIVGQDKVGNLMVLGGNQGDMVSIRPFSRARVLGYRWPGKAPYASRYKLPVLASDGRVSTNEA